MPLDLQPLELGLCWLVAMGFFALAAFETSTAWAERWGSRTNEGAGLRLAVAGRRSGRRKSRQPSAWRLRGAVLLGAGVLALGACGEAGPQTAEAERRAAETTAATLASISPDSEWHARRYVDGSVKAEPAETGWGDDLPDTELQARPAASPPQRAPYAGQRLIGCDAVRAAGRAPLYRGDPDYHPAMDGDNDGIACEPIRR